MKSQLLRKIEMLRYRSIWPASFWLALVQSITEAEIEEGLAEVERNRQEARERQERHDRDMERARAAFRLTQKRKKEEAFRVKFRRKLVRVRG